MFGHLHLYTPSPQHYLESQSNSLLPFQDLVYDYYAYPQLYAQDIDANANDGDKTITTSDDIDEFIITRNNVETNTKHVTYVPNGAVISNIKPTQEIPEDALEIENKDYEEEDWLKEEIAAPNGVKITMLKHIPIPS